MYAALQGGLQPDALKALYAFVPNPGVVDPHAFGILNLAEPALRRGEGSFALSWPAVILALLTGLITYWQIRQTPTARPAHPESADATSAEKMAHRMSVQMRLVVPATTVYFTLVFPAGIALYWFMTTLVSVLQQGLILRRMRPRSSS
jgi:YidC/Oxa1 family membrane protein insertase